MRAHQSTRHCLIAAALAVALLFALLLPPAGRPAEGARSDSRPPEPRPVEQAWGTPSNLLTPEDSTFEAGRPGSWHNNVGAIVDGPCGRPHSGRCGLGGPD